MSTPPRARGALARGRVGLLALLAGGCFHSRAAVVAPAVGPPLAFDPAILGNDTSGLADAAERLCATLTRPEQKSTGFALARRAFSAAPNDPKVALALAHCAAMAADWEADGKVLEATTAVGIEAAKAAGAPDKDPKAAYWLALSLGLAMRQKGLEALPLLPQEMAALKAAQAVPDLDLGGPLRVLGLLYLRAPAWPAGPGDLEAGLDLLKQTAQKYPSHPLNHLFYAEALRESGDGAAASAELQRAAELARPELWGDYAARWQADVQAAAK